MIKRELYLEKIRPFIDKDIIKVLTGIRRCGKSVMLQLIIDELKNKNISENNIIFINFDSYYYNNIQTNNELSEYIYNKCKNINGKVYLFFDEIQNVESWEKSINSFLIDLNVDIYITGSNAKLLSNELATYISGRYIEIKIYPFSFKETIDIKKENNTYTTNEDTFDEYIQHGGMPFIFNLNNDDAINEYLQGVYDSVLLKDILQRNNIQNVDLLNRLIKYILANIGHTFSANSISKYFKNEKRNVKVETIYNYLTYCENAFIIQKVHREDVIGKKILKFYEKFYVIDHGLREAVIGGNKKSIELILENIVYIELLRRKYEVTIGKLKNNEIDFICRKQDKIIYVQVSCWLDHEETFKRELKPLLKLENNYPKYIISMDKIDYSTKGIIHKNIIDFLLE